MATEDRQLYRFGPRDRRGLIAGARSSQIVLLAVALGVGVALLRDEPGRLGVPLALLVVGATGAVAFVPIAGQSAQAWLPTLLEHLVAHLSGRARSITSLPELDAGSRGSGPFRALVLGEFVPERGPSPIGVLADIREGVWAAAIPVRGEALALLDPREREQRLQAWASVLNALSSGADLHRLQWIERTVPDRADAMRREIERAFATPSGGDVALEAARSSYRTLAFTQTQATLRHEVLVIASVRAPRHAPDPERHAEDKRRLSVLSEELERLAARCRDAGLEVERPLDRGGLATALRAATERVPGTRSQRPWPTAVESRWSALRTDGTWHATYWIAEWPRSEVHGDFLLPLFFRAEERRTISLVMARVGVERAVHETERARTSRRADAALQTSHGFALTARARRDGEAVVRREQELAQGHAAFRFCGYITVTATEEVALERACSRIEQAGALARLDLRRLYGAQSEGFCCSLPLGRGCA